MLLELFFCGAALVLAAAAVYLARHRRDRRQSKWQQEQQERDEARCQAIEEGLRNWLAMLELPTLAEQRKLQAAARQLRIVLVEQLMRGPVVR